MTVGGRKLRKLALHYIELYSDYFFDESYDDDDFDFTSRAFLCTCFRLCVQYLKINGFSFVKFTKLFFQILSNIR